MTKFLKALVIVYLVLSGMSLYTGILLFERRELLKGRTQKLEDAIISLGSTIESSAPAVDTPQSYEPRDLDDCPKNGDPVPEPATSEFWETYAQRLELNNAENTLNLDERSSDLMRLYRRDPLTGKKVPDPTFGTPMTTGPNTMQAVIDDLQEAAENQYALLNETRLSLSTTRKELNATVMEHNERKLELREAYVEIKRLRQRIAELEAQVRQLEQKIEELEGEIQDLKDQLTAKDLELVKKEEAMQNLQAQIGTLEEQIAILRDRDGGPTNPGGDEEPGSPSVPGVTTRNTSIVHIEPGEKGGIAAVNPKWSFVILDLTEDFLTEALGSDREKAAPNVELWVRRTIDGKDLVIGKVRIRQIKADQKLAIADNLAPWEQVPLRKGDVVFF